MKGEADVALAPAIDQPSAGAVGRTLSMLELLAGSEQPLKLSDIAQRLGIPKSAAHRGLTTLMERGWAEQNAQSDCYGLTLYMSLLGQAHLARLQIDDLRQSVLDDLSRQTRELVRLTTLQKDRLVWTASSRGRRSGLVYEPGLDERIVPFATANGKIWLSTLPREQAVRIAIEAGMGVDTPLGAKTISTIEALYAELDRTAARGYGTSQGEAIEGVGAVAVLVKVNGVIVGTVSVAAPLSRLDTSRIKEIVPLLNRTAQNIALAWQPGQK